MVGDTVGTLTSDTPAAVIGTVGAGPTVVPVDVVAHALDTGNSLRESTQVADETDIGTPLGTSLLDLVGPLAIPQAATDIYSGAPANESGRMCLSVSIRETQGPLRFCNRYVGTGSAGDMAPGLPELALRIRVYRGNLRVLRISLRIPAHVHGQLSVRIALAPGAGGAGAAALLSQLSQALGGGPAGPGQTPASIPALRQAFTGTGTYDGLDARFSGWPAMRLYRIPSC